MSPFIKLCVLIFVFFILYGSAKYFGPEVAIFVLLASLIGAIRYIYLEDSIEKEQTADKDRHNKIIIKKINENIARELDGKFESIVQTYRHTVTENHMGVKNYIKFEKELIKFIESTTSKVDRENLKILETTPSTQFSRHIKDDLIKAVEGEICRRRVEGAWSPDISSHDYEAFCANRFEASGWRARITALTGDQGVDILIQKNGIICAVQCKKYSKPVGNKAVQEVVSGMRHYSAECAIVVAPNGFTKSAFQLAKTNEVNLIHHDDIPHFQPGRERSDDKV